MVKIRKFTASPLLARALATVASATIPLAPVRADPVADFYAGKTIQVLIGFSPGGGYDLCGRLIARHMGRHIPGNPKLVPQNMLATAAMRETKE